MSKKCRKCGYWIDEVGNDFWVDVYDDDACYDENLNMRGYHEPED